MGPGLASAPAPDRFRALLISGGPCVPSDTYRMRPRPLHLALAIAIAAAIALPAAAAPVELGAARGTMPASVAKDLKRTLETAIGNEKTAQSAVSGPAKKRSWSLMERALKYSRTQLNRVAAGAGKYDDTGSETISHDVAGALKSDAEALDEANHKPSISRVRALIAAALRYKADALSGLTDLAASAPTPTYGPLGACVFVTNNGNSSTETVKVTDPGAAGFPGHRELQRAGPQPDELVHVPVERERVPTLQRRRLRFRDDHGQRRAPERPAQSLSFPFVLGESNDVTTTDCGTHQ